MVARILCPTLETMLKKTLLAICEVNIKYSKKLEIGGSIHIRSDGDKVLTFLLDEELPSNGSVVDGQADLVSTAVDLVNRIARGSLHEESLVPNSDNGSETAEHEEQNHRHGDQQVHSSPETSHISHTSSSNRRKKSHPVKVEPVPDYMDDSALENDLDSSDLDPYGEDHATPDLMSMEDMEVISNSTPSTISPNQPSSTDESQPTDLSVQSVVDQKLPVNIASSLKTCVVRPVDVLPVISNSGLSSPQIFSPAQEAISGTQPSPHLAAQVLTSMLPQNLPVMSPMSQSQSAAQQRDHEMMLMQQSMMGMMALQAHTAPGLPLGMGMQPMFAGMPLKMEPMSPPIASSNTMPTMPNVTPAVPSNPVSEAAPTRGRKAQAFANIDNLSQAITDEKGNKKWQCVLCGIMLSSKFYLNSHINAVHTRTRIYPCEICGKLYYSHGAMRIHKLRQHWVDKRHKCPHCSQKFVLPFELRAHIARKHKQTIKSE